MDFWVWGWGASETIQACPEEQEGGGAGNGGAESSTPWPQKPADLETPPPPTHPFKTQKSKHSRPHLAYHSASKDLTGQLEWI